jgi:predicted metalloprotease
VRRTRTTHVLHGVLAGALALALVAGCASEADFDPLLAGGGGVVAGPAAADDPAAVAQAAVADVDRYWRRTYPETYGADFQPLQGGFHASRPETPPPACGATPLGYADIEDNALYCPQSDYIAWDEVELIPWINENFGAFTIGIVFAHEFAHAVQARTGTQGRTVDLELQADCFAGAWARDAVDGGSTAFEVDARDLDDSVAGLTHGSGFDRIGSFLEGYEQGPATCAAYDGQRRATVEIPFESDEQVTGGNMPLYLPGDEPGLLASVETDLNDFYALLFESLGHTFGPVEDLLVVDPSSDEVECGGQELSGEDLSYAALYCEDEDVVVIDGAGLVPDLYTIGDFAVAAEIARLWAQAAQSQLGMEQGPGESLQADCLTGVWAFSSFEREDFVPDNLVMSAGDLDEGIMGFLAYGVPAEGAPTAFERTDALRTGFVGGYRDCEEYAPLG